MVFVSAEGGESSNVNDTGGASCSSFTVKVEPDELLDINEEEMKEYLDEYDYVTKEEDNEGKGFFCFENVCNSIQLA